MKKQYDKLREIVNSNGWVKENNGYIPRYPNVSITSSQYNQNQAGIYGVYYKNKLLYVGCSLDVGRRCLSDHMKPSQFLLQRILSKYCGSGEYYHEAYKLRDKLEFRLLVGFGEDEGFLWGKIRIMDVERLLIEKLDPVYNINK